jgi:hypothetical protein
MASVSQTYAGTFLNASELVPLGQRRTAVVHAAVQEVIGQENKPAIVLDLVATNGRAWPKRVVLNKGNALQLAAAYGDDTDHWVGRQITVWSENVMFQGRLVPGIKVLPAGNGAVPTASIAPLPPPDPPAPQTVQSAGRAAADTTAPAAADGSIWNGPNNDVGDEIPF